MRRNILGSCIPAGLLGILSVTIATLSLAQVPQPAPALMPPGLPPTLVVDLMSTEGAAALGAQWRVSDVSI